MRSWIDDVKRQKIDSVLSEVGMKRMRMNSLSPCPSCNREHRNKTDKRGPIGVNPESTGWACFRCGASGDIIDLVSFNLHSSKFRDLSKEDKDSVKSFFVKSDLTVQKRITVKPVKDIISPNSKSTATNVIDNSPFSFSIQKLKDAHDLLMQRNGHVYKYLTSDRLFIDDTIKHFMLGHLVVGKNDWLCIPLRDIHGKIINCKYRLIPTDPSQKKQYRICKGKPVPLFGWNDLSSNHNDYVICVEGEIDAMTLHQYGLKDKVVATTTGAGTNWPDEWLDAIEPYSSFYIWYDDDKAGKDGAKKLVEKIGEYRCMEIKAPHNDANTCLQKGMDKADVSDLIINASSYMKEELRKADFYRQEIENLIMNPNKLVGFPTGSQKLDKCLGGIREGLWIITGDTGHGKTTWATWLLREQAKNGVAVMVTSFEQRPIGTVQKLLRMQIGDDFMKVSNQDRSVALNQLSSLPLFIMDHYGELDYENLVNIIRFSKRRYGVKVILIDHLGFIAKRAKGEDERQAIERVVRDLATIAINDKITIMVVCHPNNVSVSQQRRVKITDLKGASAIRQDAHVGVVVERQDPKGAKGFPCSTIHFDKIRSEFGKNGSRVTLAFDPLSCVYADDWNSTPSGKKGKKLVSPAKQKGSP
ncbi:MAG: DnaB-like helicase C-terminal domain-containing protein [Vampirovibrionia bacterium]